MQNDSIDRRAALARLGITGLGAAAIGGLARAARGRGHAAPEISVTVLLNEPIGTIKPAIYSQFAEHIGGVIYDGIWVGPDSKVAEHRRHPPRARRARQAAWAVSSCAGREAALPTSTTGATASARADPPAPLRPLARGHRVEPLRHARVHSLLPALRGRALFRRQRRHRLARRVSAMGRILQCTGRLDVAGRRARRQRRSASRSASATGASATRAGAAAAISSPRITAANTASSPSGCRSTACRST